MRWMVVAAALVLNAGAAQAQTVAETYLFLLTGGNVFEEKAGVITQSWNQEMQKGELCEGTVLTRAKASCLIESVFADKCTVKASGKVVRQGGITLVSLNKISGFELIDRGETVRISGSSELSCYTDTVTPNSKPECQNYVDATAGRDVSKWVKVFEHMRSAQCKGRVF